MASTSALEVVSVTAHNTQATRAAASVNVESGRSCSRALGFIWRERPALDTSNATVDRFATYPNSEAIFQTEFQARVGSLYFPQQGFKSSGGGASGGAGAWKTCPQEMYASCLNSMGKLGLSPSSSATNIYQFLGSRYNFYQSLERSNVTAQSGIPLSNSRMLAVQSVWNAPPAPATLIDLYLMYTVLIRVFNSGSNLEV